MSALFDAAAAVDMWLALLVYLVALDVWVMSLLVRSEATRREKALWSVVVLLCPVVGCVLWYVLGPTPRLVRPGEERGS